MSNIYYFYVCDNCFLMHPPLVVRVLGIGTGVKEPNSITLDLCFQMSEKASKPYV